MKCARCDNPKLIGGQVIVPHRVCAGCRAEWVKAGRPAIDAFVRGGRKVPTPPQPTKQLTKSTTTQPRADAPRAEVTEE